MKISILGYGTFGSAIATRLILNNHTIYKEEINDSDLILVSVPSFAVSDVLISYKKEIKNQKIIICSKGFDKSGDLFSNVLNKEFPNNKIYFLYGPTLAEDLNNGSFSIMILAGDEGKEDLKKELESENLKIELSDDIVGVQVGSALKNTVGILIGIVEGAGLGQNTQAFVYSKGLEEIQKIGIYLGAKKETFIGPTCAGDLFVKSRSRILGIELGKGRRFEDVSKEITYPKEGISSLKSILNVYDSKIDLKFFKIINDIIFNGLDIKEAIIKLASIL